MKNFKIFTALIIVICMPFLFFGCGAQNNFSANNVNNENIEQITTDTSVWLAYEDFNGSKEYEIKIEEPRTLSVRTITRAGWLGLKVEFEENVLYDNDITYATDNFFVSLSEIGDYKITLTGNKHDGEVKLSWRK